MNAPSDIKMAAHDAPARAGLRIPDISELPRFIGDRDVLEEQGMVALVGRAIIQRPLKLLRAQVLKRATKLGARLIGVTSAAPDAGKSFVTSNLAATLSRIPDQQVILIDLDLRRPSVADRFGMTVEHGIEAFLNGTLNDLRSVGRRFEDSGLMIYPAGRIDDGSGELLAGARFEALLAALRQTPSSTIVLFDLPPAFVGDDALTAIGKIDGYIHVVDDGVTPKRQAEEVRAMMDPAQCLGAVLNRYSGRWNDSYSYSAARKYAKYYEAAD